MIFEQEKSEIPGFPIAIAVDMLVYIVYGTACSGAKSSRVECPLK